MNVSCARAGGRLIRLDRAQVKWQLMVTSCYRRMGNYPRALELYERIHAEHPENVECLRYLVAICKALSSRAARAERGVRSSLLFGVRSAELECGD